MSNNESFSWVGSQKNFVDQINIEMINHIVIGQYGGNSKAGQFKNEDGCLVWVNQKEDWELAIILDAHNTAESAEIIVELFENNQIEIKRLLSMDTTYKTFKKIEEKIFKLFQSKQFLTACRNVKGETACLIVVRKDNYLWWFSVGDCVLYLFHPELTALGQYQLNQRQFFEWIGQVNTFKQEVPCYNVGIRELRQGENRIFLTTDGLIECPNEPYATPVTIYNAFRNGNDEDCIRKMLSNIAAHHVRDSTTIICWKVTNQKKATIPSNVREMQ